MAEYLYQLALMGSPDSQQIQDIRDLISEAVEMFGLTLNKDVQLDICPAAFNPSQQRSSAVMFIGALNAPIGNVGELLKQGIPVLPLVSNFDRIDEEIPTVLKPINCLSYSDGFQRAVTALLECTGLLPRQRRVFVSYRRTEAKEAALQLYDALSARMYDVFLDTRGIPPAEDFQAMLWHRLCDSDVLIMLDTTTYFESRWTSAEFGRALAKGISVLRVGWPDVTPSSRVATASLVELVHSEINVISGELSQSAVDRICIQLEKVRSQGCAVRHVNLVSNIRHAIEKIGGTFTGVGVSKAVYIHLPNGKELIAYPTVGVPTSTTLHDASTNSPHQSVAVVYDHVGLHPKWLKSFMCFYRAGIASP